MTTCTHVCFGRYLPDPQRESLALDSASSMAHKPYRTFDDFYPFYLSEHSRPATRRLHFAGTTVALALILAAVVTQRWRLLVVALVQAYALAWIGHFFFERNKPATFRYPWLSFLGDWRMWWQIVTGKIPF